jgi:hypothetical protein
MRRVVHERAGGIRRLRGQLASEPIANVVLGEHDLVEAPEGRRLVFAQPEDLREREAFERWIRNPFAQALLADQRRDLAALLGRPSIAPQQGRTYDFPGAIEEYGRMHLARKTDAADLRRLELRPPHDLLDGADRRLPPVVGMLLSPAGLGSRERQTHGDGGLQATQLVDDDGLDAARPDVQSHERSHLAPPAPAVARGAHVRPTVLPEHSLSPRGASVRHVMSAS